MLYMNSMGYIQSGGSSSDELQSLREHPTIKDFASVDGELYDLIKSTNKTLLLMVDLAKAITAGGEVE
jgi:hypothetical protein